MIKATVLIIVGILAFCIPAYSALSQPLTRGPNWPIGKVQPCSADDYDYRCEFGDDYVPPIPGAALIPPGSESKLVNIFAQHAARLCMFGPPPESIKRVYVDADMHDPCTLMACPWAGTIRFTHFLDGTKHLYCWTILNQADHKRTFRMSIDGT